MCPQINCLVTESPKHFQFQTRNFLLGLIGLDWDS